MTLGGVRVGIKSKIKTNRVTVLTMTLFTSLFLIKDKRLWT